MGLKNCQRCGQVFASNSDKICSECQEEIEENFEKVRDYIYDHGQASLPQIHEDTGVSIEEIKQFIREGRLVELNTDLTIDCKRCGAPIKSGKYCEDCRSDLSQGLSSPKTDKKQEPSEKKEGEMHTDRWRR
ncbi:MAG: hypothetical protein ACQEQI_05565 [Bacillota bacterium]